MYVRLVARKLLVFIMVIAILIPSGVMPTQVFADSEAHGLKAEYYTSSGDSKFNELKKTTIDSNINFPDFGNKFNEYAGRSDYMAVRWQGRIQADVTESYTFYMIGDNGFRVWIDNALVIDHWADDWDNEQTSAPIHLEAGRKYTIKIEYFELFGGDNLFLRWSSPSLSKTIVPSGAFYLPEMLHAVSDLTEVISQAQTTLTGVVYGDKPGQYPRSAADALTTKIQSAQNVAGNPNVTSEQIEQAINELTAENKAFKAAVIKEPWNAPGNGNPVMPGYFADPTVFYDQPSNAFYSFATMDGIDYNWQRDPHVAYSKDMVNWEYIPVSLPAFWPTPTDTQPLGWAIWAPSIMKHPTNGKYYLLYSIEMKTYVAYGDTPLGPWTNATKGTNADTAVLLPTFDGQFFVDSDNKVYLTYGGSGNIAISALKFDSDFTVSIDNSAPEMTDGDTFKQKKIPNLPEANEGSMLYKKAGIYYLFYSVAGSQSYRLRYATATSITGPYTAQPGYVVVSDPVRDILGPGHASVFEYGGNTYLSYHRQLFPFVDSKRQVAINQITFNGNSVSLNLQDHAGLRAGNGALESIVQNALANRDKDYAFQKMAIASSVSDYKGGTSGGEVFPGIPGFYKADYALDDNYATRWMAGVEQSTPSSLIVDLGGDTEIGRTETTFEYVTRMHNYKIEYLEASKAANINAAKDSAQWSLFSDRTQNFKKQSPAVDLKSVTARYMKITIVSADLPKSIETINPGATEYSNRVSIVEFKVFGNTRTSLKKGIVQAQTIHDSTLEGTRPGEYSTEAKAALQAVMNAAGIVRDNTGASEQDIKAAILTLNNALTLFYNSKNPEISVDPSDTLLVHYKLDETEGTRAKNLAQTGAAYDGTLQGGVNWTSGIDGGALEFNGTDGHIKLPNGIFNQVKDVTISSWVKLDVKKTWQTIYTFSSSQQKYMILTPQGNPGGNPAGVSLVLNKGTGEQRISTGAGTELPSGIWSHVVFTLSGSTGKLYVNGQLAVTKNDFSITPGDLGVTSSNFIGKPIFGDPLLDGKLDDFRIYTSALSDSEVKQLFDKAPLPERTQGLRADYYTSQPGQAAFYELKKTTIDSDINFSDMLGTLTSYTGQANDVAVRWTGQIQSQFTENYKFYMIGDNGFRVWIDNKLIIDHWSTDWNNEQTSSAIALTAGQKYDVKVEFSQFNGGASLFLRWSSPSVAKSIVPQDALTLPVNFYTPADVTGLVDNIQAKLTGYTVGNAIGQFPQSAWDALNAVIQNARAIANQTSVASNQIKQQLDVLKAQYASFKSSVVKEPWDGIGNGNPIMAGYFADPTLFYDTTTDAFYSYATTDGITHTHQREPHVAYSKDMVKWEYKPMFLPSFWPSPTAVSGITGGLWAPSIIKHPSNGKYYLTYSINRSTYIAYSDSPTGPWINATSGTTAATAPLLTENEMWGGGDAFDGQLFADTDGKVYLTFGGWGSVGITVLSFASDFKASIDNTIPGLTDGNNKKFKRITGLTDYNEASAIFKKDSTYYMIYSPFGSQNYQIRYATSSSPLGPYVNQPGTIVKRDDARDILGPGHASVIKYGGDYYLGYHRQSFPMVDSKRLVAINKLNIDGNSISLDIQNQSGLRSGTGALETLYQTALSKRQVNLALGKPAIASSVSDFKGGTFNGEVFPAIANLYKANYAVDDNYGTRWMAGVEQNTPSSLIVDLGGDHQIGSTETIFEYVVRGYNYKIEYLEAANAANIQAAQSSNQWKPFADRSSNGQTRSPFIDNKDTKARYMKLTIISADLPNSQESSNPAATEYTNRVSVVEFRVFENGTDDPSSNNGDPLLKYDFDESTGTTVINSGSAQAGLNGTLKAGASSANGLMDGAVEMNGTDGYVSMPDGVISTANDITVSSWFKLDVKKNWQTLYAFATGQSKYMLMSSQGVPGNTPVGLTLVFKNGGNEERISAGAGKELPSGVWKHVAFTLSGGTGKLYVDGILMATKTDFTIKPAHLGITTNNYIGKSIYPDPNLDGKVDDFRIYNRALKDTDIAAMVSAGNLAMVNSDKAALTLGDLSTVTSDLALPSEGSNGSTISWASNKTSFIDDQGKVQLPAIGQKNEKITLTALIKKGSSEATKTFEVTLLALTDRLAVQKAAEHLSISITINQGTTLPISGDYGTAITWKAADSHVSINKQGLVSADFTGDADKRISTTVTAEASLGEEVASKTFDVTFIEPYAGYILSYFKDSSDGQGQALHFGYSYDGLHWVELNNNSAVLKATLGSKAVRDPFLMRKKDGSLIVIATQGWDNPSLYLWDSQNLTTFTNERLVKVSDFGPRAWAPEAYYDGSQDKFVFYWSDPNVGPIFSNTTSDFVNFSASQTFFSTGYPIIDATITQWNNEYYLFFKDERGDNTSSTVGKAIKVAKSSSLVPGSFKVSTPEFITNKLVEGPFVLKSFKEDKWYLYYDYFNEGGRFGVSTTTDLNAATWTPLSQDQYNLPAGVRHGGSIPVTQEELSAIIGKWGAPDLDLLQVRPTTDVLTKVGMSFNELNLPVSVEGLLKDGSTRNLSVTWNQGGYDKSVTGVNSLTGIVTIPTGITNVSGKSASIKVIVSAALKLKLQAAITEAEALIASDYTSSTWAVLAAAKTQAKAVYLEVNATQSGVDQATSKLNEAINGLEHAPVLPAPVTKTLLQETIVQANTFNAASYTSVSWAALQQALVQADLMLASDSSTQSDVDQATNKLNEAINGLEHAPVLPAPVTKTLLKETIVQANTFNAALYTSVSWAALQQALVQADLILASDSSTQLEIDVARSGLLNAISGLRLSQVIVSPQTSTDVKSPAATVIPELPIDTKSPVTTVVNGVTIVKVADNQSSVVIPASELVGLPVQIQSSGVKISIDTQVMTELLAQGGIGAKENASIIFDMDSKQQPTNTAPVSETGAVRLKLGSESFDIRVLLRMQDGKEIQLENVQGGVEISLPYKEDQTTNASMLAIYYYNVLTNKWEYVGGKVNPETKTVGVKLQHLSRYAVLGFEHSFNDVPAAHWASSALSVLTAKQIVLGAENGLYYPDKQTTRAQFTAMLVRALKLNADEPVDQFTDVKSTAWYARDIAAASKAGLIQGMTKTEFGPNAYLTREQMALLLVRALEYKNQVLSENSDALSAYTDGDKVSQWARNAINQVIDSGIMIGKSNNKFDPASEVQRAEVAQAIYQLIQKLE